MPLAIVLAVMAGALLAAAIIFFFFARLIGFFFGLATIAAAEVVRLLIRNFDTVTHGMRGVRGYPQTCGVACNDLLDPIGIAGVGFAVGRGTGPIAARPALEGNSRESGKALSLGVPVRRLQLQGYVLAGAVMAFGGALLAFCCSISSRASPGSIRWFRPC